jgi:hypothetical protein
MLKAATGSIRDAGALLLAVALGGWIVFGLAWFVAELIATVLAGACVGYVLSHLRSTIREQAAALKARDAEIAGLKQLMVEAQAQGVYAKAVVVEGAQSAPQRSARLPFLGGVRRG